MAPRTIRMLLMGGIGAGKSTLARFLQERGALVINADSVGHQVLEEEARLVVAERWPMAIVAGRIDRKRLAEIVFADPEQLRELEALTHPAIRSRILDRVGSAKESVVVVEVPVPKDLLGDDWLRVAVVADRDVRAQRMLERGMSASHIEARMSAQPTDEEWSEAADLLVENNGTVSELEEQIDQLLSKVEADLG